MYRIVTTIVVCGLLLTAARSASAQTQAWEDRAFINVNYGVQSSTSDLVGTSTFPIYGETAAVGSTSSFSGSGIFDIGAGVRVWRNFSIGVSYHQGSSTGDGTLKGAVPHPIFFNQPRTVNTTVPGLERKESAEHLQFGWMIPLGEKMDVQMFAGPSFFRLQQDTVISVKVTESGSPFTTVVATPTVVSQKRSVVGYNVGADFSYLFWQNDSVRLGGGAFVRYALGTATVPVLDTDQSTDVGGIQFGFGARLRF